MYTPRVMGDPALTNLPVLILNVNFEPLHVCNTRRALGLIMSGKAEIILNGRGVIHSSTAVHEIPSVIRLSHYIRRPRPRVSLSKREILRRDEFTCQYCGRQMRYLTIDHVIPRHRGGPHTWQNLVAACASCNRQKGGKSPYEAGMTLRRQPFEPRATASYRFGTLLQLNREWQQFMEGW
jgi:5-methylcytosine-specific restriction endonuclease McrA